MSNFPTFPSEVIAFSKLVATIDPGYVQAIRSLGNADARRTAIEVSRIATARYPSAPSVS